MTMETTSPSSTPAVEGAARGLAYGLVTFVRPGGQPEAGLVVGTAVAALDVPGGVAGLLTDWDQALPRLDTMAERVMSGQVPGVLSLDDVHLLAPVPRPGKMLYAAANYQGHLRAARRALGLETHIVDKSRIRPYSFVKLGSAVIGPHDPIVIGSHMGSVDWEVELALVIGRGGRNISVDEAMAHVAGYLVANDVSCRERTMRDDWPLFRSDWLAGKSFDTFAPLGPWLVPRHLVSDPLDLRMTLRVNGRVRQDAKTSEMIFTPAEQIAYASSITTLEPGDVIATVPQRAPGWRRASSSPPVTSSKRRSPDWDASGIPWRSQEADDEVRGASSHKQPHTTAAEPGRSPIPTTNAAQ